MPEGHTVHRIAGLFNQRFSGHKVSVESPQGRFSSGADLIDSRVLLEASAIGKHMFLEFDNQLQLRVHLGIYGKWGFEKVAGIPAEPRGQVRARFSNSIWQADLRGPTACEVITGEQVEQVRLRLGPDPLAPDHEAAEASRFIERVIKSKTSIGQLLMNQEVISGIGNVYRAELLFRAGLNPHTPGTQIEPELLNQIWQDASRLMRVGVETGIMITRDELLASFPKKEDRYFTYKREGQPCRKCFTPISIEIMATRKLYFCPTCQP